MKRLRTITIPGQLISKKNNMQAIRLGPRASIGHKKVWREYEKMALEYLKSVKPLEVDIWPVYMHVFHYRRDRRAFDHNNLVQGICDVLQGSMKKKDKSEKHKIIPEDDMRHLIPIHESQYAGWEICKENPRTVITFTTKPNYS
jgi:hypothetical protein